LAIVDLVIGTDLMAKPTDEQQFLQDFLSQRDWPCPICNYNLRGLTRSRCPECGEVLALQVNVAEPKLAGLLFIYLVLVFLFKGGHVGPWTLWVAAGVGTFICTLSLLGWIRIRCWLNRQSVGRSWLLAAICWGIMALSFIAFLGVVWW
jgi:hypothetical protein